MNLLFRFAIFSTLIFSAGTVFAQGGACPAGANYANPASGLQAAISNPPVTLGSLGVTNCFYISAAGADTNSGTSESSPWAHAPGMATCSGNCAKTNPSGGEGFIFRGGDTWHFGNSGASPATGGTWNWSWSGSSGNPIYLGIDPTWHSGSSWARPIMTGDNPTSTGAVSSCAYQSGGSNQLLSWTSQQYTIVDNFELTGLCQNDSGAPFAHDDYVVESAGSNNIYEHLYLHGWTHTAFHCSNDSGMCFNMQLLMGSNNPGDQHLQIVVDGSDSDPAGAMTGFGGCYNISQSVFNNAVGFVCTNFHSFHDNLLENITQPGDGAAHGNVFESSGEYSGNNVFYNNVLTNICLGNCNVVNIWPEPAVGKTDYFFNNVEYNTGGISGNYFDVGQNANSGNQGTVDSFNNTWENTQNGPIMTCAYGGFTEPLNLANNHYITDGGSAYQLCPSTTTYTTELVQTHSAASGKGFSSSQTYAYSPATSGSSVGTGTNETSGFCSALLASSDPMLKAAGSACESDTSYACSYDSTHHSVVCPEKNKFPRPGSGAWNIGAYQSAQTPGASANAQTTTP